MKKIIILLLFISTSAFGQSKAVLESQVMQYVNRPRIEMALADQEIANITNAYISGGEERLDEYLARMNNTWYDGLDIYISDDTEELLDAMHSDQTAFFKNPEIKKAVEHTAFVNGTYVVVIFSFNRA